MLWFLAVGLAADPTVIVSWKRDAATLYVRGGAGEHVAPEASYSLSLQDGTRTLELEGFGADLEAGVALSPVRGHKLFGALSLSLCEDGGSRCRLADLRIDGQVADEPKGSLVLHATPAASTEDQLPFPAQIEANAAFERARTLARAGSAPLVIDFGAVWCPPCNMLSAEVFHAADPPAALSEVVLVELDVDDPSSWELKDRYHVGGYPTLVAVDAAGAELGRLVGYPGRAETEAWLAEIISPHDDHPTDLGRRAWDAVRNGDMALAKRLIAESGTEPESVELSLARFHVAPGVGDAQWLAERAPGRGIDWIPASVSAARSDPALRLVVSETVSAEAAHATPYEAAQLFAVMGEIEDGETSRMFFAAAAALTRANMRGDPVLDKGYYSELAWLLEHAGREDEALQTLQDARDAWPDEPTFHTAMGRALLHANQPAAALGAAEQALAVAWGDNLLTAAVIKARAMVALGQRDAARAWVDGLLTNIARPSKDLDVRTLRYIEELEEALRAP